MIRLEQPSIAVNDSRVASLDGKSGLRYHMWRTWDLPKRPARRQEIISYVAALARRAPRRARVKNLVISCHGNAGVLGLGEGFGQNDVGLFAGWDGLFEMIWLNSCLVSRDSGRFFCGNLAFATGAHVVASTEIQTHRTSTYPYGYVDGFEGRVNVFEPANGRIRVSTRFRSAWQGSDGIWHANE